MLIKTESISRLPAFCVLTLFLSLDYFRYGDDSGLLLSLVFAIYQFIIFTLFLIAYNFHRAHEYDWILPQLIIDYFSYFFAGLMILTQLIVELLFHFFDTTSVILFIIIFSDSIVVLLLIFFIFAPVSLWSESVRFRQWTKNLSPNVLVSVVFWMYSTPGLVHLWSNIVDERKHHVDLAGFMPRFRAPLTMEGLPENIRESIRRIDSDLTGFIVNPSALIWTHETVLEKPTLYNERTTLIFTHQDTMMKMMTPFFLGIEDFETKIVSIWEIQSCLEKITITLKNDWSHLTKEDIQLFKYVGLLVKSDYIEVASKIYSEKVKICSEKFKNDGMILFPGGLFHPIQLYYIRSYFENHLKTKIERKCISHDGHYGFIWSTGVAIHFNHRLIPLACDLFEMQVRVAPPLLLYYLQGSRLSCHVDYHPFLYSCSILLEKDRECEFCVIRKDQQLSKLNMDIGDTVIFRGQEYPHYREFVQDGKVTSLSLSFDYDT